MGRRRNLTQKFEDVENEWAKSHPSLNVFEVQQFVTRVMKRKSFEDMLLAAGVTETFTVDVQGKAFGHCAPIKQGGEIFRGRYRHNLLFEVGANHSTTLDVIHRLTHLSLGVYGYLYHPYDRYHGVDFAGRYLDLVFRFHEKAQSAPAKKAVKTLLVANNIKTYEHSEESKLRREKRTYAEELRAQLDELRS